MNIKEFKDILIKKNPRFVLLGHDSSSERIVSNLLKEIGSIKIKELKENTNIKSLLRKEKFSDILDDNLYEYKNHNILSVDIEDIIVNIKDMTRSLVKHNLLRNFLSEVNGETLILTTGIYKIVDLKDPHYTFSGGRNNLFFCDLAVKIINGELNVTKNRYE